MSSPRTPARVDGTALIWGVIFALIAATGLWRATGHSINWGLVSLTAPLILVVLGALGLVLSRTSHRHPRSQR